jgi:predicted metal-dependent phosphotriesterase family hydrolase
MHYFNMVQCRDRTIFLTYFFVLNLGTIQDHGQLAEFATEFGSFCQFDLFGIENSYYQTKPSIDFPSDAQRIAMIQSLLDEKFEDKILMAHDVHTKHRLVIHKRGWPAT